MNKRLIGLDEWLIPSSLSTFLQHALKRGWMIYDVSVRGDAIHCFAGLPYHREIGRDYPDAQLVRTTGALGMFIRNLRKPSRIISVLLSVALWIGLSNTIFDIEIRGDKQATRKVVEKALRKANATPPFYHHDEQALKKHLKKQLENEVAWLEVVKNGSRYYVYYTPKEFAHIEQLNRNELIAQKDAVIADFDIQHGSKVHQIHDVVYKGEVLVSNVLMDSFQKPQELYVKGKVFGYTWNQVDLEMKRSKFPVAYDFYQLLFEARSEVSKDFIPGDRIHKENILHFDSDAGTIRLSILYTVYEDISTPR